MAKENRIAEHWPKLSKGLPEGGPHLPSAAQMEELKSKASSMLEQVGRQIGKHPEVALGVALSVGLVIGWMVKRR